MSNSHTRPPTLADVASLANVSVPTASRVLNGGVRGAGSGTVELRERVEAAAQTLGYAPIRAAQAIKDGLGRSIAVIVGDLEDQGAATIIAGVLHAAEDHGLSVAVRATLDDYEREERILRELRGERHRALIIATSRSRHRPRELRMRKALETLANEGATIAIIGDNDFGLPSVTVDNRGAAATLAQELVNAGHRRFAVISGPDALITADDRVAGFLQGLRGAGVDVDQVPVVREAFSRDGGYAAFGTLAERADEFDIVAAMSDAMAVGAIVRAREYGLILHDGVEVTGFDHVPVIGDLLPSFTTVEIPLAEMGALAVKLVTDLTTPSDTRIAVPAQPMLRGARAKTR